MRKSPWSSFLDTWASLIDYIVKNGTLPTLAQDLVNPGRGAVLDQEYRRQTNGHRTGSLRAVVPENESRPAARLHGVQATQRGMSRLLH